MPTVPFPIAQAPDVTDTPQAGYLLIRTADNTGYEHKPPSYITSRPGAVTLTGLSDVEGTPVSLSIPIYKDSTEVYELRPLVSSDITDATSNSTPSKVVKRTALGGATFKTLSLYNDTNNIFSGSTTLTIRAGQYQSNPLINLISYSGLVNGWIDENADAYLRNISAGTVSADWLGSIDLVLTGDATVGGDITISGNISASSADIYGDAVITGTLSANILDISLDATIDGTTTTGGLTVSGLGTDTIGSVASGSYLRYIMTDPTTSTFNPVLDASGNYVEAGVEGQLYTYRTLGAYKIYAQDTSGAGYCYTEYYDTSDPFYVAGTLSVGTGGSGTFYSKDFGITQIKDLGALTSFTDNYPTGFIDGTGTYFAANLGDQTATVQYDIYTYKTISGTTIYASTPYTVSFTETNTNRYYAVQVSWGAVAGATGYLVKRTRAGVISWTTTTSASLVEATFSWGGSSTFPNISVVEYHTNIVAIGAHDITATRNITAKGTITAFNFSGSGSTLTDLNASALTSGTIPVARMPTNVAYTNVSNTFTASQTINSGTGTYQTFTLGTLGFYKSTNTLAVNEVTTSPGNSSQFAYHWTSGSSGKDIVFCIAKTFVNTCGFAQNGTDMYFYNEKTTCKFIWKKGVGFGSTVSTSGTNTMELDNSNGKLTLTGPIYAIGYMEPVVTKTSSYPLTSSDSTCLANAASGAIDITLPTAVGISGRTYRIKKIDSSGYTVTVKTTSSQTIDGSLTKVISTQWTSVQVQSDGSNWMIV